MKFTKIKKRKIYHTWINKNRRTGLLSTIYGNPNGGYHFVVSCFKKRCGLMICTKENCDTQVFYNSLDEGLIYNTFEECRDAVIRWHKARG